MALVIFSLIGIGHLRIREETGARAFILVLGILGAAIVLILFIPTLLEEPLTVAAIVFILVVSLALNFIWKRARGDSRPSAVPATPRRPGAPAPRPCGPRLPWRRFMEASIPFYPLVVVPVGGGDRRLLAPRTLAPGGAAQRSTAGPDDRPIGADQGPSASSSSASDGSSRTSAPA